MGVSAAGAHDNAAACEVGGEGDVSTVLGDVSAVLGDMGAVLGASDATALADSDAGGVGTIIGSAVGSAVGGAVGAGAVGAGV